MNLNELLELTDFAGALTVKVLRILDKAHNN